MSTSPVDYDALAKQAGAVASVPRAQSVDYTALAKQSGAVASVPNSPSADYSALAKQAGAVASVPGNSQASPQQQPGFLSRAGHFIADTFSKTAQQLDARGMLDKVSRADDMAGQGRWSEAWEEIRDLLPGASPDQQVFGNKGDVFTQQKAVVKDTYNKAKTGDYSGAAANVLANAAMNAEHVPDGAVRTAAEGARDAVVRGAGEVRKVAIDAGDAVNSVRNTAADSLQASAEKNINTALNPTTKVNKSLTKNQLAPGLVERGVTATSLKGLQEQAQSHVADLGEQIDQKFEDHAAAGTKVSPQPILDKLEQEKQSYVVDGVPINEAYVDRVGKLQKQVEQVANANGGGDIPLESLRRIRQIHDNTIAQSKGGFALAPDDASAVEALKTYTDAIRSTVSETDPELAKINQEFSFWKNVVKVAGDSILRKTGQRAPLTKTVLENVGMAVGAKFGGPLLGAYAGRKIGGTLGDLQNSTIWNTLSAQAKGKIADLLSTEDGATTTPTTPGDSAAPAKTTTPAALAKKAASVTSSGDDGTGSGTADAGRESAAGGDSAGDSTQGSGGGGVRSAHTVIPVPGQARPGYQAQYALRELSDLQASHSGLTFRENPRYPFSNDRDYQNTVNQGKIVNGSLPSQFNPALHITDNPDATNGPVVVDDKGSVLGGNGRAMMLQRVYGAKNAKAANAYRDMLVQKAGQFGLDPEAAQGMKRPVLVRQLDASELSTPEKIQNAITDFNKKGTAELTPGERAISDSRRVSDDTLDDMASRLDAKGPAATIADALEGKAGSEVLQKLINDGVVTSQERAAFQNEGGLTKAGRERIGQLMIGRFFRDPEQLDSIAPSVRGKIERIAAPLAQVEAKGEWNLTPDVQSAVDLVEAARQAGTKNLDDFMKQDGLFGKDKYSPNAVTIAKALQTSKSTELTAAARQYAQDAAYASKGESMFGETPTPEKSFADSIGSLKSGARSEAEAAMKKSKVRSENARLPYDAPTLEGDRAESYSANASDLDHLQAARFTRVPLAEEDAKNAIAHVANLSGFEYMNRMTTTAIDEALSDGLHGKHFSPDSLDGLISNLKSDADDLKGIPAPALDQLMKAAQDAKGGGKSLLFVKDHQAIPDATRGSALTEEVNHAAQYAGTGDLRTHLRGSASGLTRQGSLGSIAQQALESELGYQFNSPHEAAAEIGVRLMEPGRYQELGLSKAQAHALAFEYMQRLEKEYGRAAVDKITSRVRDAFR